MTFTLKNMFKKSEPVLGDTKFSTTLDTMLYLKLQKELKFKKFFRGYNLTTELYEESPLKNSLFVGSMGSGKSIALRYSIIDYYYKHHNNLFIAIVDLYKGANDFRPLFGKSNVISDIGDMQSAESMINIMYKEIQERKKVFLQVSVFSIEQYEFKFKTKLSRMVLLIEEFQGFINSAIKFNLNYEKEESLSFKFHNILKEGEELGVCVLVSSQRGTSDEFSEVILPYFGLKHVFKVQEKESKYLLPNAKANLIKLDEKGMYYDEKNNKLQFPYMPESELNQLIKDINPVEPRFLSTYLDEIKENVKIFHHVIHDENKFEELEIGLKLKLKASLLIRDFRSTSGLSNKEFAEMLDIDESNLSKIIKCEKENLIKINLDTLIKILVTLSDKSINIKAYLNALSLI